MSKEFDVTMDQSGISFYWAFFVGIAGAALGVASALIYFCLNCRGGPGHSGYKMTRVV
jgi:hypothetical protein